MMKMVSIASGSSGNCSLVSDGETHILIDTGISLKKMTAGLAEAGIEIGDVSGVLITHEHNDHISGLGVLLRKYQIPVYTADGTIRGIRSAKNLGEIDYELFNRISADQVFSIGTLDILPIATPHDANEPCMYRVFSGRKSAAVMTDLGYYDDYITAHLSDVNMLLLEANHDVGMLETGPYPYHLKQRILSASGHLSNESCGRLLADVLHDDFQGVLLGHLSKENNYDKLAYEAVRMEVDMAHTRYCSRDFQMYVAAPDHVSEELAC